MNYSDKMQVCERKIALEKISLIFGEEKIAFRNMDRKIALT